jgi:EAL domain-containing protein (putative c-di-GMP-specific phosphodiesterase class I)
MPTADPPPAERRLDQRSDDVSLAPSEPVADAARPRIDIADAVRNDRVELWFEPKIDLKRKCLVGAEARVRIHHPSLGMLPPGSFVPEIAEGGIARLTEHALIATLESWTSFDAAGFNLHLAVNVPMSALIELAIPALIEAHRPPSDRWPGIILEVSEDQIVRDAKRAQRVACELAAGGIRIAIDDFGSGYSSLASLRALPFVELKLDGSFVRGCASDATNAAICQTAVDLAHRFGSAAVAEGIENADDLRALMVMGCDFGQGALIAPSMPQPRFIELLRQRAGAAPPPPSASPDQSMAAG